MALPNGSRTPMSVNLEEPGPPLHDDATAAQIRELITKGALGGLVFVAGLPAATAPTSSRSA